MFAAFQRAKETKDRPTVILAHTIKGYGMGDAAEAKNIAHQVKKMNMDGVRHVRDFFNIPVTDDALEKLPYIKFEDHTPEYKYIHERRQALKGYVPSRLEHFTGTVSIPLVIRSTNQRNFNYNCFCACP